MRNHLHAIGTMTGNSLDGADLVLTRFGLNDGSIKDIQAHSVPFPADLRQELRAVRSAVERAEGRVDLLARAEFGPTLERYTALLAGAVADLRAMADESVDLIGFHGQTCGHRPPSIAGEGGEAYTVQLGDGQALADRTGITVVFDFRSDDLMAGGEGAPLAPSHHERLAHLARSRGIFPVAFCNAGNTGNLSLISADRRSGEPQSRGWDTGPFNHFPDHLMRREAGQPCDLDGAVGRGGAIHLGLLAVLFDSAAVTADGRNFLLCPPPRSADPEWYRFPPELPGEVPVNGRVVPFADRVRTATYFASYAFVHALSWIPAAIEPPTHFAVSGGGWRNPLCLADFRNLLAGNSDQAPILPAHAATFDRLRVWTTRAQVEPSSVLGFDPTAMEARIFADAAVCRVRGEPFTRPETTGVTNPTVCGIIRFPDGERSRATPALRAWLDYFGTEGATFDPPGTFDGRWSRASAGWMAAATGARS